MAICHDLEITVAYTVHRKRNASCAISFIKYSVYSVSLQLDSQESSLSQPLKEYMLYTEAIKVSLCLDISLLVISL